MLYPVYSYVKHFGFKGRFSNKQEELSDAKGGWELSVINDKDHRGSVTDKHMC